LHFQTLRFQNIGRIIDKGDAMDQVKTISAALVSVLFFTAGSNAIDYTQSYQNGTNSYEGAEDLVLGESYPDACTGKFPQINVGWDPYKVGGRARGLVRFDISALGSGWQPATEIAGARVKLFLIQAPGSVFTDQQVHLYRVADANKGWTPGNQTTRTTPEINASCWNYLIYNPTLYCPTCENAGQPMHQPWAGSAGCGSAGTDYTARPVATATISSSSVSQFVTFEITDPSFLKSWIDDRTSNEGFLVAAPGLETGAGGVSTCLFFASCDFPTAGSRPVIEVDLKNFNLGSSGNIVYSVGERSKVSMLISNGAGTVVKEVLFAAARDAGTHIQEWDCKDDPINSNDIPQVVPDGVYTVKILATRGIWADYLLTLGTTDVYTPWPGNHCPAIGLAIDDGGTYVAAGSDEGMSQMVKIRGDGSRVWTLTRYLYSREWAGAHSMAVDNGRLFCRLESGEIDVLPAGDAAPSNRLESWSPGAKDLAARGGKLLVATVSGVQWLDQGSGANAGTVALPSVAGVALDNSGKAFVISGGAVVSLTQGNSTPQTVIGVSALSSPVLLDINPSNGDIYVAETGTSQQVKRFSASGELQQAYGRAGGRPPQGAYDGAAGFLNITDIAVESDGSFWITEAHEAPRRTAHFGKDGSLIVELYGGMMYATHAAPLPDDPTEVWMDCDDYHLLRIKVDWAAKSWDILGTYKFTSTLVGKHYHEGGRFWPVRHKGKTYLYRDDQPCVLYFDVDADRLRPVAVANICQNDWVGPYPNGWWIPEELTPPELIGRAAADSVYPPRMFSWYDKNGDGGYGLDEITYGPQYMIWSQENAGWVQHMDSNFVYTGVLYGGGSAPDSLKSKSSPPFLRPEVHTVDGVDMPSYDWSALDYTFDPIMPDIQVWNMTGAARDADGNYFFDYNYEKCGGTWGDLNACFGTGASGRTCGGHKTGKWSPEGRLMWMVGRHTAAAIPSAGEGYLFRRMLGAPRGCVVVGDYLPLQYMWDRNGLWVGRLLDSVVTNIPLGSSLTASGAMATWICGEQFGGMVYEVTTENTPGLGKGDVLLFGGSCESAPVYRINGFDEFKSTAITIRVEGGQIVEQSGQTPLYGMEKDNGRAAMAAFSATACPGRGIEVRFYVPGKSLVSIDLFSLRGRRIASAAGEIYGAGTHIVRVPARPSPGMYLLRFRDGERTLSRRITLAR
jgi:hypothetical protein